MGVNQNYSSISDYTKGINLDNKNGLAYYNRGLQSIELVIKTVLA